ncbi:sodium- and chloride-dependent betaine transporter [Strongylocentrotus purpuratus]|uniref:Transporter n=1 Tax=Strongylocentrotus purpuratus TaxID=7668 RepID=A0A7M7RB60_STRPU|nr:sodium- and chloride-dependent betaine transporter [Strongylocentrotus purpuratus]
MADRNHDSAATAPVANGLDEKELLNKKLEKESENKSKQKSRGTWTSQLDFLLALIGASVGLGNVWRFPYLCYKNGGGAFLIPYFICLILGGIPQLILEIGLGQWTNQAAVTAWDICPIFKGLGGAGMFIQFFLDTYYIVIMAWALYYMFMSFTSKLPYSHCDNEWNTPCCLATGASSLDVNETTTAMTSTEMSYDPTGTPSWNLTDPCNGTTISSTVEFWDRKILQIHLSDGIEQLGGINWQLLLCMFFAWFLCYLCICKGVKTSGKVVYFTAPFPYILMTILLIRAVTLEGAMDGIVYYLKPDISRLNDSQVWMDAATQIFFSYSLGQGVLIALGSYNKHKHNFIRDALIFSVANTGTSLYSGFVIFAVLGFMAGQQGVDVSVVAKSGPGLAFIAYPEAITQMPASTLWAVLFFLCLLVLGIDSQFVGVEGFVATIVDLFPNTLLKGHRREIFCIFVCLFFCIAGIPMCTYGGMYIFQLFDYYAASGFVLLWVSMFESITIGWAYGGFRFMKNVTEMSGVKWISPYMITAWIFLSPLFTFAIFIFSLVKYKPLTYNNTYVYPWWGYMIGWILALMTMLNIPVFFFYQLIFNAKGNLIERWNILTTPYLPHCRSDTVNAPNVHVVDPIFSNIELGHNNHADGEVIKNGHDADIPPPPYNESVGIQTYDATDSV